MRSRGGSRLVVAQVWGQELEIGGPCGNVASIRLVTDLDDCLVHRRGHADLAAFPYHVTVQVLHLGAAALEDVLEERRAPRADALAALHPVPPQLLPAHATGCLEIDRRGDAPHRLHLDAQSLGDGERLGGDGDGWEDVGWLRISALFRLVISPGWPAVDGELGPAVTPEIRRDMGHARGRGA
jgi:hypothetical protein